MKGIAAWRAARELRQAVYGRTRKDQLHGAIDEGDITPERFDEIYRLAERTSRLIGGFMSCLRQAGITGHKFTRDFTPANPKPKARNPS